MCAATVDKVSGSCTVSNLVGGQTYRDMLSRGVDIQINQNDIRACGTRSNPCEPEDYEWAARKGGAIREGNCQTDDDCDSAGTAMTCIDFYHYTTECGDRQSRDECKNRWSEDLADQRNWMSYGSPCWWNEADGKCLDNPTQDDVDDGDVVQEWVDMHGDEISGRPAADSTASLWPVWIFLGMGIGGGSAYAVAKYTNTGSNGSQQHRPDHYFDECQDEPVKAEAAPLSHRGRRQIELQQEQRQEESNNNQVKMWQEQRNSAPAIGVGS